MNYIMLFIYNIIHKKKRDARTYEAIKTKKTLIRELDDVVIVLRKLKEQL